ncbi:hypothetical protein B0T16DRAFT_414435 [Cercophora newfieldiana]|uniref:F-box domain-containing protein n=1 Tax=Cercophora newfieldiana TaxID=92897 RepID=A0AA40CQ19_9PEZI|nr:hypothetical protein B0T16DRAFT_414435 [Cercophora newfieldiana]
MEASDNAASSQRRQFRLERLTALLRSNPIIRRWWDSRPAPTPALTTSNPPPEKAPTASSSQPQPQPQPTPQNASPVADTPIAVLLPGMTELALVDTTGSPSLTERYRTTSDEKPPIPKPSFLPPASSKPDLLLTMLPSEIHSAIFEAPQLSLHDLVALRNTCRTLRRDLPIGIMERKLKVQNYAGWDVVFEMHGHRYPGTTYGNRRLCGKCVVPKIRGLLIEGAVVREYFARRRAGGVQGLAEEDVEWPDDRGMCFPCLWSVLVLASGVEVPVGGEIYKLAGISTKERFRMLDGTDRKMCERCLRDIHENAVPCPHCTDFSEWCKTKGAVGRWPGQDVKAALY